MDIYIDADGCPVVDIVVSACKKHSLPCWILCDTAHEIHRDGANTIVIDKGSDSVDFALVNRTKAGDIVITQDYGLASMCLSKGNRVLHQDGWEYTAWNMDALLFQRFESKKYRQSGGRIKGPAKRTAEQNAAFQRSLETILSEINSKDIPQAAYD